MNFDKSEKFRRQDAFVMASIIQLGTFRFCEKFLNPRNDPYGQAYDLMTKAARSGKKNIAEASEHAATSRETETRRTNSAKASLCELRDSYETWLMRNGNLPWRKDSAEAKAVSGMRLDTPSYSDDVLHDCCSHILEQQRKFSQWLDSGDDRIVANTLIILIGRTEMLVRQQQCECAARNDAPKEQANSVRPAAGQNHADGSPSCPECGKPMRRRKAKSGKNAGNEFWGCSGYPDCKGVRKLSNGSSGPEYQDRPGISTC